MRYINLRFTYLLTYLLTYLQVSKAVSHNWNKTETKQFCFPFFSQSCCYTVWSAIGISSYCGDCPPVCDAVRCGNLWH